MIIKTRFLLFILLFCSAECLYSNFVGSLGLNIQRPTTPQEPDTKRPNKGGGQKPPSNKHSNTTTYADSAYYSSFVKKNGWIEGVGPKMDKIGASHLSCSYKFLKKEKAKHWSLVCAVDGFGNLTTQHNFKPYLLNQFDNADDGANSYWKEKLRNVCQIALVESADGKDVIQEKYLDADGNVILIANVSSIDEHTYQYIYFDEWHRPAFLRTDKDGDNMGSASYVEVIRNSSGYETLIKYKDRFGMPQKNIDGDYMKKIEYDADGNIILRKSLNINEMPMMDSDGNCGIEYKYDSGRLTSTMCFDSDWKPMSYPDKRGVAVNDSVCGYYFEYDEYGREKYRGFIDVNGSRCENRFGVWCISHEYDDHGLETLAVWRDKKGGLVAGDESGIAKIERKFDERGIKIEEEKISIEDSIEKKSYCFKREYNNDSRLIREETIWFDLNLKQIRELDINGDELLEAFYDLNNIPVSHDGYHKK